jgi:hypothetical protein
VSGLAFKKDLRVSMNKDFLCKEMALASKRLFYGHSVVFGEAFVIFVIYFPIYIPKIFGCQQM